MYERLIVVTNPDATGAKRVKSEVLAPLNDAGITHEVFETPEPGFDANVSALRSNLRDGDRIIVAAGDGTASQVINAVVQNGLKYSEVAPLPYGGFVDLASKRAKVMDVASEKAETEYRFPMTVDVNRDFWRYSPGYTTLGFTALAASSFANPESRQRLKRMPKSLRRLAQVAQLGEQYFAHRNQSLPAFQMDKSGLVHQAVTDILVANNRRMGGIIGLADDHGEQLDFGVVATDVSKILPNIRFGLMALRSEAPHEHHTDFLVRFKEPSEVPVQTEGEFTLLKNVSTMHFTKDPRNRYKVVKPAIKPVD